jgi:aminoglycoside phosphotransferase family enzyme/predicted kinase
MELQQLIAGLSSPAAYPFPVDAVAVRQTHISVVFLAGNFAYKIKKPVRLPFLDFSTLEKRRVDCENEVRLNARLAPHVYLGVVPVNCVGNAPKMEGPGEPMEWAVKMVRLPEEATLEQRLQRDQVTTEVVTGLANKLAAFHAAAEAGEHIASFGRFDAVARNIRENLEQALPEVGVTLSQTVFERLKALTEAALERLRPTIEARAAHGVPRDTHGDLHLDHVYLFPDQAPPADCVIVDCIEFNERFRYADPVADMAFLTMDLEFHGRDDLARAFADAYFAARGDVEGRALLPLYVSYRAAVRGKVEGMELKEAEIPAAEKAAARARARGHWLLALRKLEEPSRVPCMVLVGGLPGTGKSTLARGLAERAGFQVVRSDAVRKELAGANFSGDLYSSEWSDRTYAECLRRAEAILWEGGRVIIDANFREESRRRAFMDAARRWCVPAVFFVCCCGPETSQTRLSRRKEDVSDADWAVYQQLAASWEEPSGVNRAILEVIQSDADSATCEEQALGRLRGRYLWA